MKNLSGFETEYLRIIEHSHYEKKQQQHMWLAECKACGAEFLIKSGAAPNRKSCGCVRYGTNGQRIAAIESLHENMENMLKRVWVQED